MKYRIDMSRATFDDMLAWSENAEKPEKEQSLAPFLRLIRKVTICADGSDPGEIPLSDLPQVASLLTQASHGLAGDIEMNIGSVLNFIDDEG